MLYEEFLKEINNNYSERFSIQNSIRPGMNIVDKKSGNYCFDISTVLPNRIVIPKDILDDPIELDGHDLDILQLILDLAKTPLKERFRPRFSLKLNNHYIIQNDDGFIAEAADLKDAPFQSLFTMTEIEHLKEFNHLLDWDKVEIIPEED